MEIKKVMFRQSKEYACTEVTERVISLKRRVCAILLAFVLLLPLMAAVRAAEPEIPAPSAILIEKTSGKILYEKNAHEKLAPASVTKIMTLLLVMEALQSGRISWDDTVTTSSAAAAKGGSQIYLEENEQMPLSDVLKAVVVASANDGATALAEHLCGSEAAFVEKMNERAEQLGMQDTHFVNCTGLDDDPDSEEHLTTAYDIALMSRELLGHEEIKKYTTIWMDSVRDGTFGLANTNKLVRFYDGTTGLKTGFTSGAGFCLSASAMRDGMELIAVVLHCDTSANRFESAKTLLNHGFANYTLVEPKLPHEPEAIPVILGRQMQITPELAECEPILVSKEQASDISYEMEQLDSVNAPITQGQKLGTLTVRSGETVLAEMNLIAPQSVEDLTFWDVFLRMLRTICMSE